MSVVIDAKKITHYIRISSNISLRKGDIKVSCQNAVKPYVDNALQTDYTGIPDHTM